MASLLTLLLGVFEAAGDAERTSEGDVMATVSSASVTAACRFLMRYLPCFYSGELMIKVNQQAMDLPSQRGIKTKSPTPPRRAPFTGGTRSPAPCPWSTSTSWPSSTRACTPRS